MGKESIFRAGHNCWQSTLAQHATPLIDCEHYYRALYQSIVKAKHSIFIVGWDIDSRIRLLRGEEERNATYPSVISDLIAAKARENPDLQIYLLRWDSSLAFFSMREVWAKEVWDNKTPENVHCCLDGTIPMGGSQHQKIAIIDDEVVFTGGMDVAVHRWDTRDHKPKDPERVDHDGPYGPFHDVHSVIAGPVVEQFAKLVRWRWQRVCDSDCIPFQPAHPINDSSSTETPPAWPESYPPQFKDMSCAIARTIPFMDDAEPEQEVRHMLLDLIEQAERFIYIENQFLTREEIAEALNKRLKACPKLKVLLVSSYSPKSTMECEAYWSCRIQFKEIVEAGIPKNRILVAYSSMYDRGVKFYHKRFHSKVMVIDDKYAVIGSANISNRSMTLDTECDLVFHAESKEQQRDIAHFRNDLIAEHSGLSIDKVDAYLSRDKSVRKLCRISNTNRYALREVEDHKFTDQSLTSLLLPFSDPEEPIVRPLSLANGKRFYFGNPSKKVLVTASIVAFLLLLVGGGYWASQHISWFNADSLKGVLETVRGTFWALPAVCLIYVVSGIFFFPVTVLSLAVAAVFGPIWGPLYGICGAVASALFMFGVGHMIGGDGLKKYGGKKVKAIDEKFSRSGVVGVAAIRLIPIAPFSLVNLVAGVSSIRVTQYALGTFLGMFPPMIAKGLVGDSLTQIVTNPSTKSITYLVVGIIAWIIMIFASQKLVTYLQNRRAKKKGSNNLTEEHDNSQIEAKPASS